LILSDVIGDPIDRIASGPTAPDPSTYEDAFEIIERYQLLETTPASILSHLKQGIQKHIPETLKPADPIFNHVCNLIVGNNSLAAAASLTEAEKIGYRTLLLSTSIQGEASQVGQLFGAIAQQIALSGQPVSRPACIIAGGETTVTINGKGLGGRNQEVALGAVLPLARLNDILLITLATDGGDGPTDAAGAVVSGHTLDRALNLGLNPRNFLVRNDSYHFFEPLGDLLLPGPTLTNVGDLTYLFAL
jgi:glycerate 2-kinase